MLQILSASGRVATPWKNGGGVTREVAAQSCSDPPGFDWRISIADIDGPGPFSIYPGVDRTLAVLDGQLELAITGRSPLSLSSRSPAVSFPGEAQVSAVPLSRASRDLNIMVRRDTWRSHLETVHVDDRVTITSDARITVALSLGDLRLRCRGSQFNLGHLDAMLFHGETALQAEPARKDSGLMVIRVSPIGMTRGTPLTARE